ncbi:hypothetical protein IFM89_030815 [Coptis chinensis]|uniref:Uncharacterized protein n=1 Tax=Coptis chinensis TaxID=261450 RepID=A0A835LVZ7_9MAGN|nr:hypothetical protein IFM89_030815 [Coptis chinensis]
MNNKTNLPNADIAKKGGATQVEIAENALNGSSDASNKRISFAEKVKANASMEIDIAVLPIPGMKAGISGDKFSQSVPIPTPISTGTGDTLPENMVGLEAGDAQTQEARTDHVDAIPQVGVAENIAIDDVALLPLAVEMQPLHPLNAT